MKTKMLFAILVTFIFASCGKEKAKPQVCTEYSVQCELEKENILFLPLEYSDDLTDAVGRPFSKVSSAYWHVSNKKIGVPIWVKVKGCSNVIPTPGYLLQSWGSSKFKIDTVDLSSRIPGMTKALLLLTGSNEIHVYSDEVATFGVIYREGTYAQK